MVQAFLYAVLLTFGLIIPLGIQNIFVFNQGASQKYFYQCLPVIFTASLCDATLIILAVSGVSYIVLQVAWIKTVIFSVGLCFLLYMAYSIWNSNPANLQAPAKALTPKKQILFAISVSILNPHAIIDTMVVIGSNALHFSGSERIAYTTGCIFTSFCWFLGLALLGKTLHRLDKTGLLVHRINKCSAIIVFGVALYIAYQLFYG